MWAQILIIVGIIVFLAMGILICILPQKKQKYFNVDSQIDVKIAKLVPNKNEGKEVGEYFIEFDHDNRHPHFKG